jgi:hypothetical protein
MIGADFRFNIMKILALAMAVTVIAMFIQKRSASGQKRYKQLKIQNKAVCQLI